MEKIRKLFYVSKNERSYSGSIKKTLIGLGISLLAIIVRLLADKITIIFFKIVLGLICAGFLVIGVIVLFAGIACMFEIKDNKRTTTRKKTAMLSNAATLIKLLLHYDGDSIKIKFNFLGKANLVGAVYDVKGQYSQYYLNSQQFDSVEDLINRASLAGKLFSEMDDPLEVLEINGNDPNEYIE